MESNAIAYCEEYNNVDMIHMPSGVVGRIKVEYDENCCAPTQDVMFSFTTSQHFQMFDVDSFMKFIEELRVANVSTITASLVQRLEKTQRETVELAGKQVAKAHMSGHRFYVAGNGHSHTVAEELYKNADEFGFEVLMLDETSKVSAGDIVLYASNEAVVNAKDVDGYKIGVVSSPCSTKNMDLVIDMCDSVIDESFRSLLVSVSISLISQTLIFACKQALRESK